MGRKKEQGDELDNPLLAIVAEHWESIAAGYMQFEDHRPTVLTADAE